MGEGELVTRERPFQSMNAVLRTSAKERTWEASWRGLRWAKEESIVAVFIWSLDCFVDVFWGFVGSIDLAGANSEGDRKMLL